MITYDTEQDEEIEVTSSMKYDIPGCRPLVITRDDVASDFAYYRLVVMKDITLQDYDFTTYDMFLRYAFYNLGLLHFPLMIVSGEVGGGKSLFLTWIAFQISRLFPEKRATTDFSVPPLYDDPPIYDKNGDRIVYKDGVSRWQGIKRYSLYDQDFLYNVQDGMNDLGHYIKENDGRMPPRSELEKIKIYNANLALDECKKWARKGLKTNLASFVSDIITMRRHLHCGIEMAYVNPAMAPGLEVIDLKTHFVTANGREDYNGRYVCEYYIQKVYGNRCGMPLTLYPDQNLDIWNSFDIPEFMPAVPIYRGNKGMEMELKRRKAKAEKENSDGDVI